MQLVFKVLKICFPFNHCNFHLYWAAAVTFEWVATACLYCPTAVFGGHWKWNCSSKTKNYLSSKNLVHISLILSTFSRKCEGIFSDHFFFLWAAAIFSFSLLKLSVSIVHLPRSLENEKNKSEEENVRLMQDPKRSTVTIVAAEKL